MKKPNKHEFWVTNVSPNHDISLADLRLTVRHGQSYNLLDSKHYSYTLEQLQKSAESGSIKFKSRYIKVRENKPVSTVAPGLYTSKFGRVFVPLRTNVEVVIPRYEELDFDLVKKNTEKFAAEEADMIENDTAPIIPSEPKKE